MQHKLLLPCRPTETRAHTHIRLLHPPKGREHNHCKFAEPQRKSSSLAVPRSLTQELVSMLASTVRDTRNDNSSLTPLKDHEKCISSRKRRRSEDDDNDTGSGVLSKTSTKDSTCSDGVASWEFVDEEEELAREVTTLKATIGQVEVQVTAAAAQLKQLRALVALLAHHRSQAPKKSRVVV